MREEHKNREKLKFVREKSSGVESVTTMYSYVANVYMRARMCGTWWFNVISELKNTLYF